jgi:uridine phosphorylase
MAKSFKPSELVLNPDGSVYHIALKPHQVKENVIVVGDPGRVDLIASLCEAEIDQAHNREFYTKVVRYNGHEITVMSTGIGTDNIDIAINELDAAVNIDLEKREPKTEFRQLNIIRLGTSGALQEDIPIDSCIASKYGLGFDGLMNYYDWSASREEKDLRDAFIYDTSYSMRLAKPYIVEGNQDLRLRIAPGMEAGVTATASGFYAPQGRELRAQLKFPELNAAITAFKYQDERVTNYEMETSALYGLSKMLGHSACTVCAIIANRLRGEYSKDYKSTVKSMVGETLERLTCS